MQLQLWQPVNCTVNVFVSRCESVDVGFSVLDYEFSSAKETMYRLFLKKNYGIVLSMLFFCEIVVRMCAYSMCLCECAFYIKCWINHVKTDNEACHDCIIML